MNIKSIQKVCHVSSGGSGTFVDKTYIIPALIAYCQVEATFKKNLAHSGPALEDQIRHNVFGINRQIA